LGFPAAARAALPLGKPNASTKPLETGVAPQTIYKRVHPHEPKRSIIHRLFEPDERLIVLAKAGVYNRDVERAAIYSS
jgi:hypothetical protein